jgi:hypothetical protein
MGVVEISPLDLAIAALNAHCERASPLPPTDPRGAPDVACARGVRKVI